MIKITSGEKVMIKPKKHCLNYMEFLQVLAGLIRIRYAFKVLCIWPCRMEIGAEDNAQDGQLSNGCSEPHS